MGKLEERRLPQQQIQGTLPNRRHSGRCSMFFRRFVKQFNLKCFLALVFGLAVLASSIFWILPRHTLQSSFDAENSVKQGATVQAYFMLQKSVSLLIPQIQRLEFDIYGEIGVPNTKVVVLSMHEGSDANHTDVVFGVISDSTNTPINPVSLSMLKTSFIDLFLQQFNLTFTTIFGQPSSFEILKFPEGITVNLEQYASFWSMQQILFNFTLINSLSDIHINYEELKNQLKFGLHLRSYENVYMQATNSGGSTIDPPVTVQASVTSGVTTLMRDRLKQLALLITRTSTTNLGLDNSLFGDVKEIILSPYLKRTLHSSPPAVSPSRHHDSYSPTQSPYCNGPSSLKKPHFSFPPCSNSPTPSTAPASFGVPPLVGIMPYKSKPTHHHDTNSVASPCLSPHPYSYPDPSSCCRWYEGRVWVFVLVRVLAFLLNLCSF